LGGSGKKPDDMALFRREVGDVRPLSFEKRVPSQLPRSAERLKQTVKTSSAGAAKRSKERIQCSRFPGKKTFENMAEATSAARFVKQERLKSVRPYLCDSCGKFHLTSRHAEQ